MKKGSVKAWACFSKSGKISRLMVTGTLAISDNPEDVSIWQSIGEVSQIEIRKIPQKKGRR